MNDPEMFRIAKTVIEDEAQAVPAVAGQLDGSLTEALLRLLECAGHVLVTGTGTSRFVAERFAHLLCCSGTPALFLNAADSLHGGAGAITARDVVFIISKGGRSAEINQLAVIARQRGAGLIALTETAECPLAQTCDLILRIKAAEGMDPYGMIATGSSLVNAAVCDALCVLLLKLRGYTREQFGQTHPGGAVGQKLEEKKS